MKNCMFLILPLILPSEPAKDALSHLFIASELKEQPQVSIYGYYIKNSDLENTNQKLVSLAGSPILVPQSRLLLNDMAGSIS